MALQKVKTKGTGKSGAGSSRWCTRFEAKQSSKKSRRREDKKIIGK